MNIISIDLPWNPTTKGRRALAIAGPDRSVTLLSARDDTEMLRLVKEYAQQPTLVLLDVSIDGLDCLIGGHFRPVDKALQMVQIPLLPSSSSGERGKDLRNQIVQATPNAVVHEIYPYATYKFLAYLNDEGLLSALFGAEFRTLLSEDFVRYWPPKYKREKDKTRCLTNMRYLHGLLAEVLAALDCSAELPIPDASTNLDRLGDVYDACLGLISGILYVNYSPYACLAGDEESGMILLLADGWLQERLARDVKIALPSDFVGMVSQWQMRLTRFSLTAPNTRL